MGQGIVQDGTASRPAVGRVVVWSDDLRAPFVARVVHAAGLEVVAAGSPDRGRSGGVAAALGAPRSVDDLRALLADPRVSAAGGVEPDLVLIAATGDFGRDDGRDASSLLEARSRGIRIVSLDPLPGSALDLTGGGWTRSQHGVRAADAVRVVPLLRRSGAFRTVEEDVLPQFGAIRVLTSEQHAPAGELGLGMLLYGAMDLVHGWLGEPDLIQAHWVGSGPANWEGDGPASEGRIANVPPSVLHATHLADRLPGLSGHMIVHARLADGRLASFSCSDRAGAWHRSATLLGDRGRVMLTESGLSWVGPGGEALDGGVSAAPGPDPSADVVASSLRRLMAGGAIPAPINDHPAVLASAHTALLSARTGHAEHPGSIRRAVSGDR